ncbi:MAG: electron transport complex subunit E [Firmicutes bacterium]|nr:electron transport complex subunit E [Bacillota bacterium]
MSILQELKRGIFAENPTFRLMLGMCPTLAVTTLAVNGVGMGLATTAVLLGSNLVVSALKNVIPNQVRIPSFIVIIATFVTVVSLLLEAFAYSLYEALGIFLPLIVVNCIILGRAEAYASKHSLGKSALDALGIGLGFTLSLTVLGAIREFLGAGTVFGLQVLSESADMATIFSLPPGAFITLGLMMALINGLTARRGKRSVARRNPAVAKREG